MLTDLKDECWHCGQHILTLFIWTPRIGQLTAEKDQNIVKHYRDQIEALSAGDDFIPTFYDTPRIAGAFSGWHYKDMREIAPFCQDNDPEPPDFIEMCCKENIIKSSYTADLEIDEKKQALIDARKELYYRENWKTVIMVILRFKNPLVANAHQMTQITNQLDPKTKVYFHIDWLRPGKHTFVIQHDNEEIKCDDSDDEKNKKKKEPVLNLAGLFGMNKKKPPEKLPTLVKSTKNFYVHNMLATFRTETIPECKFQKLLLLKLPLLSFRPQRETCCCNRAQKVKGKDHFQASNREPHGSFAKLV